MTKKNAIWIARDVHGYLYWYAERPKYDKEDKAYYAVDDRWDSLNNKLYPSIKPGECRKFVEVDDE